MTPKEGNHSNKSGQKATEGFNLCLRKIILSAWKQRDGL